MIHGFDSWENTAKLNAEVRTKSSTTFYSVSSSGLYGFAFVDLGERFTYQYAVKDSSAAAEGAANSEQRMETGTLTDSLPLQAFLDRFENREEKLTWRRRGK